MCLYVYFWYSIQDTLRILLWKINRIHILNINFYNYSNIYSESFIKILDPSLIKA